MVRPVLLGLTCFPLLTVVLGGGTVNTETDSLAPTLLRQSDSQADVHSEGDSHGGGGGGAEHHQGVVLASWRFSEYGVMFLATLMIILAVIIKIWFHKIPFVSKHLPESCFLIILGVLMAVIVYYGFEADLCNTPFPHFTANLFFNVLLPPIILDAAFTLYDREFVSNFFSIVNFAVVGTVFNIFTIGYSLYLLAYLGLFGKFQDVQTVQCPHSNSSTIPPPVEHDLKPVEALIFSSLISAVDPVAVLAIFDEIHVNTGLYFLVFGESLFNDGVTIVLYNSMKGIEDIPVGAVEGLLALLSFFLVVFGGLLIGILFGAFVSLLTTKTGESRVVEPLLVFAFFYMAFVFAEMVHWSGIISIIGFGLVVKRYAFTNISSKSYTTIKYTTKTVATTCDVIIFLFMGIVAISKQHYLHWGFIISTIVFCTVFRFLGTFILSSLVNLRRGNQINTHEQFIMAYGGLRGAVGFSLAVVIDEDKWYRELFVSTALAMVFVTVFVQGSTIKFFVKMLGIRLKDDIKGSNKLSCEIQNKVIDDVMGGIEAIVGNHGHYEVNILFNHLEEKYIKQWLIKKNTIVKLEHMFEKTVMEDHYTHLYGPNILSKSYIGANKNNTEVVEVVSDDSAEIVKASAGHLKTFSTAVMRHPWRLGKSRMSREMSIHPQYLMEQMENKRDRRKIMESKIFLTEGKAVLESVGRFSPAASRIITEYGRVCEGSGEGQDDRCPNGAVFQSQLLIKMTPSQDIPEVEETDNLGITGGGNIVEVQQFSAPSRGDNSPEVTQGEGGIKNQGFSFLTGVEIPDLSSLTSSEVLTEVEGDRPSKTNEGNRLSKTSSLTEVISEVEPDRDTTTI